MPINTMLNSKTSFEKKKAYKIIKRGALGVCNVLRTTLLDFCANDLFPGTLIDFCFMFAKVTMKDLARMLIHVSK